MQVRSLLEDAGWNIELNDKDLYKVFDDQIVWPVRYRGGEKNINLIFQLVEDFGGRTEKLADLFFFKIDGDDQEFIFQKITSDQWKVTLAKFRQKISSVPTSF